MNLLEELKHNIPNRFSKMDPFRFEGFIGELFNDMGYIAKVTQATGDFGADIIVSKDDRKIAVQVKRYDRNSKIGVKEIQQVIGGKNYHQCDGAIFVTTSVFTKAAEKLAQKTGVELWDWDKLYKEIKSIYLNGKNIHDFFKLNDIISDETSNNKRLLNDSNAGGFSFSLEKVEENVSMKGGDIATILHLKMRNTTEHKIYIEISNLIILDTLGNQLNCYCGFVGTFNNGYIYPGASVPLIYCWYSDRIAKGRFIKSVIVKYRDGDSDEEDEEEIKEVFVYPNSSMSVVDRNPTPEIPKKQGCFIATAVYGSYLVDDVLTLRRFRDNILLKSNSGRRFVRLYYKHSPSIADFISNHSFLKKIIRYLFLVPLVKIIRKLEQ